MIIEDSVIIHADMGRVWETFSDLACWKDWNTVMDEVRGGEDGGLSGGGSVGFCIRPFVFPVRLEPVIEVVVPKGTVVWTGRKLGIVARHEFIFDPADGGVKVTSREEFTGLLVMLMGARLGRWRLEELTRRMLEDLKRAAENK